MVQWTWRSEHRTRLSLITVTSSDVWLPGNQQPAYTGQSLTAIDRSGILASGLSCLFVSCVCSDRSLAHGTSLHASSPSVVPQYVLATQLTRMSTSICLSLKLIELLVVRIVHHLHLMLIYLEMYERNKMMIKCRINFRFLFLPTYGLPYIVDDFYFAKFFLTLFFLSSFIFNVTEFDQTCHMLASEPHF